MARTVTVTLANGQQHTYQNVPEDVTADQVIARAQNDFPGVGIRDVYRAPLQDGEAAVTPTRTPVRGTPITDRAAPDTGAEEEEPGYLSELGRGMVSGTGTVIAGMNRILEGLPTALFGRDSLIAQMPGIGLANELINRPLAEAVAPAWREFVSPATRPEIEAGERLQREYAVRTPVPSQAFQEGEGLLDSLWRGARSASIYLGQSIPQLAAAAAVSRVSPTAGMALLGASSTGAAYEGIRQTQEQEGIDSPGMAFSAALASGLLDATTGLGGRAISATTRNALRQDAMRGISGALREVGKTGVSESATEMLQNVIEQVGGGQDPLTQESLLQTLDAGIIGFTGGVVLGTPIEGLNRRQQSNLRRAFGQQPSLRTVDVNVPGDGGRSVPTTLDILSAPDANGKIVVRTAEGTPYVDSLSNIEAMRPAPAEGETRENLADALTDAEMQNADNAALAAAVNALLSDPNDGSARGLLRARLRSQHGIPDYLADQLIDSAIQTAATSAPQTGQEAAATSVVNSINRAAKGKNKAVKAAQEQAMAEAQEVAAAVAQEQPKRRGKKAPATATPTATAPLSPTRFQPLALNEATTRFPKAEDADVRNAFFSGAVGTTPEDFFAGRKTKMTKAVVEGFNAGRAYGASQGQPVSATELTLTRPKPQAATATDAVYRMAAFNEANSQFGGKEEDNLATAFYNAATGMDRAIFERQRPTEGELNAWDQGLKWAAGAQREGAGAGVPSTGGRTGAGAAAAPTAGTDESGVGVAGGVAGGPATGKGQREPTVTKVAPGEARGIRETRTGMMGTQRGRPVEGAAALTEGMRAEQELYAELEAARQRGEISDEEMAQAINTLRPPVDRDGNFDNEAFKALPADEKSAWGSAIAAQKTVDEQAEVVSAIPKEVLGQPNPERVDAEAELAKRQRNLDDAQRNLVNIARDKMRQSIGERREAQAAIRELLKDPNLTEEQRRDLQIQLRENIVTLFEQAGTPTATRRGFLAGVAAAVGSAVLPSPARAETRTYDSEFTSLLEQGDFYGALAWIEQNATNALYRLLAKKIREGGAGDVALRVVGTTEEQWTANGTTGWSPAEGVNIALYGGMGRSLETFLHEAIHAYVLARWGLINTYLVDNKARVGITADRADASVERFQALWGAIGEAIRKQNPELLEEEGPIWADQFYSNPDEALAWVMTNSDLRAFLQSIDEQGNPISKSEKSFWDKIVDWVRDLFGMAPTKPAMTALDTIMSAGMELIEAGQTIAPDNEVISKFEPEGLREAVYQRAKKAKPKTAAEEAADIEARAAEKTRKGVEKLQRSMEAGGVRNPDVIAQDLTSVTEAATEQFNVIVDKFVEPLTGVAKTARRVGGVTSVLINGLRKVAPKAADIADNMVEAVGRTGQTQRDMTKALGKMGKGLQTFTESGPTALARIAYSMQIARNFGHDPTLYKDRADALANDRYANFLRKEIADLPKKIKAEKDAAAKKGLTATLNKTKLSLRKRELDITEVWKAWEALGKLPGGQFQWRQQHQFYKDAGVAYETVSDIDIDMLDVPETVKQKLKEAEKGSEDPVTDAGHEYPGIKASLLDPVYFPYMRFGDYVVTVKWSGKNGGRRRLEFDSMAARAAWERKFKRDNREALAEGRVSYKFTNKADLSAEDASDSENAALRDVFQAIEKSVPKGSTDEQAAAFKKQLKDRVYQVFLKRLPERSLKKQFIHAKLIEGQSPDVLRVFADYAQRYASQLPKLMARPQLERMISEGVAALDDMQGVDPLAQERAREVFGLISQHVMSEFSAEELSGWAKYINLGAFGALMGSVLTVGIQLTAFPLNAIPKLLAKYPIAAPVLMARYLEVLPQVPIMPVEVDPVTGDRVLTVPSFGNTPFVKNNKLRKKLFDELRARGLFSQHVTDLSLGDMAAGKPSTLRAGVNIVEASIRASAVPMSAMDQLIFEMTGLMFAELAYKKSGNLDDAVKTAVRDTQDALGNFSEVEQPNVFRGPVGRIFRFLRTYSVQMAVTYGRLFHNSFKGSPYQTRVEAISELAMRYFMISLFAGPAATFLSSVGFFLAEAVFSLLMDDDEEDEFRNEHPLAFRKSYSSNITGTEFDAKQYLLYDLIPSYFGTDTDMTRSLQKGVVSNALNIDLSGRVGHDALFIRDWQSGDTGVETLFNFLSSNLTPQFSVGVNMVKAYEAALKGDFARAAKGLLPSWIRGPALSREYAEEGMRTGRGAVAFSPEDVERGFAPPRPGSRDPLQGLTREEARGMFDGLTVVAMGGQPLDIALAYERDINPLFDIRRYRDRRTEIKQSIREALGANTLDVERLGRIKEEIDEFNSSLPYDLRAANYIDETDIAESLLAAARDNRLRGYPIEDDEAILLARERGLLTKAQADALTLQLAIERARR